MITSIIFKSLRKKVVASFALLLLGVSAQAGILNAQEQGVFDHLHASARPFIVVDPVLTQVARARAADMARRGYFAHVDPDGHGPNFNVRKAGYDLPAWWGNSATDNFVESIAAGQTTVSQVWNEWMNSTPHRKHLMAEDPFYVGETSVGVGYYYDKSSKYGAYWVVISAPPQPAPALSITSPTQGIQVTDAQISITGTTAGTTPAAKVMYRVETVQTVSEYRPATGVATWSAVVSDLTPGPNIFRVRSLDASGNVLSEQIRGVNYLMVRPLTVNLAGSGIVSAGFAGTTDRVVGTQYLIGAAPAAGYLFAGWTGSVESKSQVVPFTMAEGFHLTANFAPNPFLNRGGGYYGLLSGGPSGSLAVVVGPTGLFTGRLVVNGQDLALRGAMSPDGTATLDLPGGLHVDLRLDLAGNGGISGRFSGSIVADVQSGAMLRAGQNVAQYAGRYTLSLPPEEGNSDATLPQGNGFAIVAITSTGRTAILGALADGRTFSAAVPITGDNQMAYYIPLYGGSGVLAGTLKVRNTEVSDLDGQMHWSKPLLAANTIHPAPLESTLPVVGSRFVAPGGNSSVFGQAPAGAEHALTLSDGNLQQPIVQTVVVNGTNQLVANRVPVNAVKAVVSPDNGMFAGTFQHPVTGQVSTFRGAVFQKQGAGFGFFLGSDQSGIASLGAVR